MRIFCIHVHKGCLDKKGGVKIKRVEFKPHCIQQSPFINNKKDTIQ